MRLVLAGTGSAVGKTTITTGLMKALSKEIRVQPFKVGPDYIDPTYHSMATGQISRNLDSFFMSEGQIRNSFDRAMKISNSQAGIIEGVRGLYEGMSPIKDVGSTASISKALNSPVILIINSRSLVRSAAAIVLGFKSLDPDVKIEAVILNQIKNNKHYLKTKKAIEHLTNTDVVGGIPRDDSIKVEQRHLGLVPAVERESIATHIDNWGQVMEENLDLDSIKSILKNAPELPSGRGPLWSVEEKNKVKIGIARDEAFNFYYQDNIDSLIDNGAKIVYFSPLHDQSIPDVDGIYVGGGYPEVFAHELEDNVLMRESLYNFHSENGPIYAECGGLMYLTRGINGHKMCNVFPYESIMVRKVQALSYVIAKSNNNNIILSKNETFKGHEFHYSKILLEGKNPTYAFQVLRGKGINESQDGIMNKNTIATYVHTHVAACSNFAKNFTRSAADPDDRS
jgi:cobyrinic acid a,c-diamide synthase